MSQISIHVAPFGEVLDCIVFELERHEQRFYIRATLLLEFVRGRENIMVTPMCTEREFAAKFWAGPEEQAALHELLTRPENDLSPPQQPLEIPLPP